MQFSGNKQKVPMKAKGLANATASMENITNYASHSFLDTQNDSAVNLDLVSDMLPNKNSKLPLCIFRITLIYFYLPQYDWYLTLDH